MLNKTTALILSLLVPLPGIAAEIKQRSYSYAFDGAKTSDSDVFVVCTGCPDDKLTKEVQPLKLALRLAQPSPVLVPQLPVAEEAKPAAKQETEMKGLIGTVYFDFDRSLLVAQEKTSLEQLARQIPPEKSVAVTGYTCSIGKDAYNEKLSYRRAQSVASYLMAMGVRVGNIDGKGKCCPASENKQLNRRVEVSCP
ncbi:MAG: OmpA family protein [Desulfuromonadaceae bacterium]|nr:OmpA family protein [Desulfuromonadaceae bacterium]